MPRNAGASDVRGGSVETTSMSSVHWPPLSVQTCLTESFRVRAKSSMSGPVGAVDLVHERARDRAGVAEADGERALGGAVRAQPQDAEVAERSLHDVRAHQLDPRVLAVGVPADEALVGLLGLLGIARDLDGLGHAIVGSAAGLVGADERAERIAVGEALGGAGGVRGRGLGVVVGVDDPPRALRVEPLDLVHGEEVVGADLLGLQHEVGPLGADLLAVRDGGGLEGVALGDDEPAADDHQQRGGDEQDGVASAAGLGAASDDVGRRHLEPPGDGAEAVHALLDLARATGRAGSRACRGTP